MRKIIRKPSPMKLKKIEVVLLGKHGARQQTATFTVTKKPYPVLTEKDFHVKRALRKYLEDHKPMKNLIFSLPKAKRVAKVQMTNGRVFYL